MIVSEGALTWPTLDAGLDQLALDNDQKALALELATEWLWALTARRFGVRAIIDRPQSVADGCGPVDPRYVSPLHDAAPINRQIIELGHGVVAVQSVHIWLAPGLPADTAIGGGGLLDPATYRVEGHFLVRQDGGGWPQTQNLIAGIGQPDTWSINYTRGVTPPAAGQRCHGRLAEQFGQAMLGKKDVRIPFNAGTVTRSGVSIVRDVMKALKTTGVGEVDQWVAAMNPNGLAQAPRIWSPDVPRQGSPYAGSYLGGSTTHL